MGIIVCNEINGNTFTTETATTSNSVNVVFTIGWKIIVDDQRDLLDIDTTSQQISSDQNTGRSGTEFPHDNVTIRLLHVTVQGRDGEVFLVELLCQPFHPTTSVQEDDSLGDGQGLVQITESVQLPFLLFNKDVELLDTLQGKFFFLDQDNDGFWHEASGNFQYIFRHSSRQQNNLDVGRHFSENIVDLIFESTRQHLVSFIENKHSKTAGV